MPTYKQYNLKPKRDENKKELKPEKRWSVKGYLGLDNRTGLEKYTTLRGFKTRAAAKSAFDDALYEFKHDQATRERQRRHVREVFNEWWPMYKGRVQPSTWMHADYLWQHYLLPHFGDYYLDAVRPLDVQKWVNGFAKTHKVWRNSVAQLSMLFHFAIQMDWTDTVPTQFVVKPTTVKKSSNHVKVNHYTLAEARQFIRVVTAKAVDKPNPWMKRKTGLLLDLFTGMRRGELFALRWQDVDVEHRVIHVIHAIKETENGLQIGTTKTDSSVRDVPIDDDTIRLLHDWRVYQAKEAQIANEPLPSMVFPGNAQTGTMNPLVIGVWMSDVHTKLGMRRITPHGLRHTKATLLAEAGADVNDIAAILGHADPTTTMRTYIHPTRDGINNTEKMYTKMLKTPSGSFSGSKKYKLRKPASL